MKYKSLGNTGLYVSELTLGTMTFDKEGGSYSEIMGATGQELATKMVNHALDAGINIFDTANVYSSGESEIMLGKALGDKRTDVLIATKLFSPLSNGPNDLGTSRLSIMREIVGARKEEQLIDNLGAANIILSDDEMKMLDEVSALKPEYPQYLPTWQRGENFFARAKTSNDNKEINI